MRLFNQPLLRNFLPLTMGALLLPLALGVGEPPPPGQGKEATEKPKVDAYGDPLPPGAIARLGTLRFRAGDGVSVTAFAPDGKTLASAGTHIRLWDVATGKQIRKFEGPGEPVTSLVFCAAGQMVAATSYGYRNSSSTAVVSLWDTATGREVARRSLAWPWQTFRGVGISPDGKLIAFRAERDRIAVRETATGKDLFSQHAPTSRTDGPFAFSPDGKLVAAGDDTSVRLWEAGTWKERAPILGAAQVLAFSRDGTKLAIANDTEKSVRICELATGKDILKIEGQSHDSVVASMFFDPDGRTLFTVTHYHRFHRWGAKTGNELEPAYTGIGRGHSLSPDGKTLAVGRGQAVELWDLGSGNPVRASDAGVNTLTSLAVTPYPNPADVALL